MKYLAIVERTADGFHGYAHRLPGCEVYAATEEEAEAGIIAAVKKYVADGNAGVKGSVNGEIEVIVAVEGPPPKRPRDDGMDEIYDQIWKNYKPEDLEWALNFDLEKELAEGYTGEEIMQMLEEDERHLSGEGQE